jgi:Flp pilus assembly protein TadG
MRDQRGVVYVETLIAFLPVFLFFLGTLQIADLSAAHIIVRHAATVAARAAVVVMPDDGRHYNDENNELIHAYEGARRADIEHAADIILGANPRLDRAAANVEVAFAGAQPVRTAAGQPQYSQEDVLQQAFSGDTARGLLDTATKGENDQNMRQQLDARVRVAYRCLITFFCPRTYTMVSSASLVYQGARYVYEAWPDSIRGDGPPRETPPAGSPPPAAPGGATDPSSGDGPVASAPDPTRPPPAGSDPTRPPPAGSDPTRPPPAGSDPTRPPPAGSDPTRPPPAGSGPTRPPPAGSDPTRPPPTASDDQLADNTRPAQDPGTYPGDSTRPQSGSGEVATGPSGSGSRPASSTGSPPSAATPSSSSAPVASAPSSAAQGSTSPSPARPAAGNTRPRLVASTPRDPSTAANSGSSPSTADIVAGSPSSSSQPAQTSPTSNATALRGARPSNPRDVASVRSTVRVQNNATTQDVVAGAVTGNTATSRTVPNPDATANPQHTSAQPSAADIIANGERGASRAQRTTTPRNHASLVAALPSNLRDVPIVRDPNLTGSTVRAAYTYDARGRITSIELHVGPDAQPRHIADHVATVRAMQRYRGLAGRARLLLERINAWIQGNPSVRPGSLAWETRREIEKLESIIQARARAMSGENLTSAQRAELASEQAAYDAQLAQYTAALPSITHEAGRGYVAANGPVSRTETSRASAPPGNLLPTDTDPALFNAHARPGEIEIDRNSQTGTIARGTVRAANNAQAPNNASNGVFVRGPNGTFVRYLPLVYPPSPANNRQRQREARAQGVVALIDDNFIAQIGEAEASGHVHDRDSDQDRGHLLAKVFGGANIRENLIALWAFRNRGMMSQVEKDLRSRLTGNNRAWVQVDALYADDGTPLGVVMRIYDAVGTTPPNPRGPVSVHWFPNYDVLGN